MHNFIYLKISIIVLLIFSVFVAIFTLITNRNTFVKLVVSEFITSLMISSIAFTSLLLQERRLMDVLLPLALIMFLSTVAYCEFLNRNRGGTSHD